MKSTAIIFDTPMIRAYRAGKKTMTRRASGLDKVNENSDEFDFLKINLTQGLVKFGNKLTGDVIEIRCPFGGIGSELWFKETWATDRLWDGFKPSEINPLAAIWYATETRGMWVGKTRSSMFMPRRFSRHPHVPLTGLRCERVQSITEADAIAEGIEEWEEIFYKEYDKPNNNPGWTRNPIYSYQTLWDSINGKKHPWESNPWVWVLKFPR